MGRQQSVLRDVLPHQEVAVKGFGPKENAFGVGSDFHGGGGALGGTEGAEADADLDGGTRHFVGGLFFVLFQKI